MEDVITKKVIELYEELITMPYSAVDSISNIEKEISSLYEKDDKNLFSSVSLLQAKTMLGKAEEAIKIAERIWNQGGKITPEVEITFMNNLVGLGLFEKAMTLAKPKLETDFESIDFYAPTLFHSSVALGDMETLQQVANLESMGEEGEILSLFIEHQTEENLIEHFKEQQKIVNSLLFGKQTCYEIIIETERGWPELEVGVFVGGDSVERYQLQNEIDNSQAEYYESANVDPLDNFMVTIYDIKEHWASNTF